MSPVPRLVLDTNVVLSALLFPQRRLEPLRQGWQAGRFVPLLSTPLAEELIAAMAYPKFKLGSAERQELLADYLPYCLVVQPPRNHPKLPACRDPFDLPFLELAAAGKADYLVTGDKDLLAVKHSFAFRIVTPAEMLQAME